LDAQQNEYDTMEGDLKLKTRELDLERLQKILSRITSLQVAIRSAKKNHNSTEFQIINLETRLSIERAKVSYICLLYDMPLPNEHPLPSEAGDYNNPEGNHVLITEEKIGGVGTTGETLEQNPEGEGSLFGGLIVDDQPPVSNPLDGDAKQLPHEEHVGSNVNQFQKVILSAIPEKTVEELVYEKKTIIEEIASSILQLEEDLQFVISSEDYDKAHDIHGQITEYTNKKKKNYRSG